MSNNENILPIIVGIAVVAAVLFLAVKLIGGLVGFIVDNAWVIVTIALVGSVLTAVVFWVKKDE